MCGMPCRRVDQALSGDNVSLRPGDVTVRKQDTLDQVSSGPAISAEVGGGRRGRGLYTSQAGPRFRHGNVCQKHAQQHYQPPVLFEGHPLISVRCSPPNGDQRHEPKRVVSLLMAACGADGGTASARRRRERRQRSWGHEALSVAAALATARHHSSGPVVVTRREEQEEEVEDETHHGLRAPTTPPLGLRLAPPSEVPGRQVEAATVGYVAAGAPSLVVAPVAAHDGMEQATVQFLLRQTLLARAVEEEEGGGGGGGGGGRDVGVDVSVPRVLEQILELLLRFFVSRAVEKCTQSGARISTEGVCGFGQSECLSALFMHICTHLHLHSC